MIFLDATDEILELLTSAASDIDVVVAYADITTTTFAGGQQETTITTATTTTILASPAASTQRQVKSISIRNAHATTACTVTVKFDKAGTEREISPAVPLAAGEFLHMNAEGSWQTLDASGQIETIDANGGGGGGGGATVLSQKRHFMIKDGTTMEGANRMYLMGKDAGFPGAWTLGTPGIDGRITDGTTSTDYGCVPYTNAATGANYLTEFTVMPSSSANTFILADVVWVNSGIVVTTTTAQAITTPAFSRDANNSAAGEGFVVGLLSTATLGNAAISNTTLDYTNSAGVAGRTATIAASPTTMSVGVFLPFLLQAGDTGVESIEGITLGTSWVSGSLSLIVFRPLTALPSQALSVPTQRTDLEVPLYDNSCILPMIYTSASTAVNCAFEVVIEEWS